VRFSVLSIPTTLLEALIYITFLVWVCLLLTKKVKFEWTILKPYILPIGLIFVGLLVGVVVSADKTISLGIVKGWFVDPLLLFGMLIGNFNKPLHVKKAITALVLSGVMLSLVAIYQVVSNNFITIDQRASAFFSSANYLSLYLVPIIVLSSGLIASTSKVRKWWSVSSALLMMVALYFTFSYSGWLGVIVGMAALMLMFWPVLYTSLGIITAVIVAIVSQLNHPKFQQMLDLTGRSSSHARLQIWKTSLLMIKEKYLTGIGLGMFEKRYLEFAERLFDNPFTQNTLHSHNVFLYFWINTGLIGFLGFVILIIRFFQQVITAFRSQKSILLRSVIAAMISLLTHGLLDAAYWKNDLSVLFWTILAFGIILSRNSNDGKEGKAGLSHRD